MCRQGGCRGWGWAISAIPCPSPTCLVMEELEVMVVVVREEMEGRLGMREKSERRKKKEIEGGRR